MKGDQNDSDFTRESLLDKDRPQKSIGFWNSCGNLFFRCVVSTSPKPVLLNDSPAESRMDAENLSVKYALDQVLMQPTPTSCGVTAAMMVLKFHRDNLRRLLVSEQLTERAKNDIPQILKALDKYAIAVDFSASDKLEDKYGMATIEFKSSKKEPQLFAKELAKHLYERGPLSAIIKTQPYNISNHAIMITGIVDNNVIYADPWDGREKRMRLVDLVKKFSDPENLMLRICIPAYSHSFLNEVKQVGHTNQLVEKKETVSPRLLI